MKASYAIARLDDLQPGDWIEVQCGCGHVGHIQLHELRGIPFMTKLKDLERRYLCTKCARKGDVVVAVLDNR